MAFYLNERTAVFIDGANLWHTMQDLGWKIDFALLNVYFTKQSHLVRSYYFTALNDAKQDVVHDLVHWLANNGYAIISKPLKVQSDHVRGTHTRKGNMDVEIVVQMLNIAHRGNIDHFVLFSGDGDFVGLIEALQEMGKRVTVVSTVEKPVCASDLRRQADNFLDLERDLRRLVDADKVSRTKLVLETTRKPAPAD